jgi:hypothetical protein
MQKNGSAKEQQETKKTEYLIEMEKEMKSKKEQMIIISRASEPSEVYCQAKNGLVKK